MSTGDQRSLAENVLMGACLNQLQRREIISLLKPIVLGNAFLVESGSATVHADLLHSRGEEGGGGSGARGGFFCEG